MPTKRNSTRSIAAAIALYFLTVAKYRLITRIILGLVFFNVVNYFILNPINVRRSPKTECCGIPKTFQHVNNPP